jgi:CLIP-associating protein 1/2
MEHSVSDIRKAAASLCIELHQKVNDDQRLLDDILKGGQATTYNLLAYYFATKEREWGIHERGTPLP